MKKNIPHYSKADLEDKAERFCAWLKATSPSDIDIERIVTDKVGFDVFPVPDLKRNFGVIAYVNTKRSIIFVDGYMYDNEDEKLKFTLAEELAHYILHKDLLPPVETVEQHIERWKGLTQCDHHDLDRDAKYLAGALLMPRSIFLPRFNEFWRALRATLQTDLQCLHQVQRLLREEFRVSEWPVLFRCQDLRLTNRNNQPASR